MNRINSDTVLHRITFPPSGLLFYILDDPGIGLISLSKSAGFGNSGIKLLRFGPETNMFYTQKFLVYRTPPYLFGCMHFRLDLLTDKFSGEIELMVLNSFLFNLLFNLLNTHEHVFNFVVSVIRCPTCILLQIEK